jgi:aspartate carbamoyltransferase regulatory subunit
LNPKVVRRDKKDYLILIKGAIHQQEIIIFNLYAPNVSTLNFIKHTLVNLNTKIDPKTVVVGVFNTPLSPTDRSFKQKSTKKF